MTKTKSRLATCANRQFFLSPTTDRRVYGGYDIREAAGNKVVGRAFTLEAARCLIRTHVGQNRAPVSFQVNV